MTDEPRLTLGMDGQDLPVLDPRFSPSGMAGSPGFSFLHEYRTDSQADPTEDSAPVRGIGSLGLRDSGDLRWIRLEIQLFQEELR